MLWRAPLLTCKTSQVSYKFAKSIVKHYSLYMYLLRLLRPIWDIKVCYRLHQDSVYKPTFGSNIVIIQNRLKELLNFIIKNE